MTLTDLRKSKGLLIDTNLLVLLTIGTLSVDEISEDKRTRQYTVDDFYLLLRIIDNCQSVVLTPNILTEASNLLEGVSYKGIDALSVLKGVAERSEEQYMNSLSIMQAHAKIYTKFGLSDAVIYAMAQEDFAVVTQDLKLYSYLEGMGLNVLNFNNFRTGNLR
ncbi:hypothetical protein [Fibrella arboris]|uniref:hypothetical protein n=1 Tax=Fibrella arboris TaxID=3242486 RepID=UPI0035218441